MKILKMPNGEELKITGENSRFYFTEKARFRKANYAGCVEEAKEEKAVKEEPIHPLPFEEPEAEPKPKKRTAKKAVAKAEKTEEKE